MQPYVIDLRTISLLLDKISLKFKRFTTSCCKDIWIKTFELLANIKFVIRCGVKKADYPSIDEKCYCFERDAQGVKNGFWHIMEVLSMPWHPDLFWPNTTLFKQRKIELERELDEMYLNSTVINERGYVRSVVIKFKQGKYVLKHQTSTTTTTTTTSTTTTTIQLRGRRSVPDDERDYILDGTRTWREDKKYFIGAAGYWPYGEDEYSTQAWVEHQFYGVKNIIFS